MKKNNFGFTLVELLIVIGIIGTLSSIVMTSLNQSRIKAKDSKALITAQRINNIAYTCFDSGGTLVPPALSGNGGTPICSNDATVLLPDISDTGWVYCGNPGCGAWVTNSEGYAFGLAFPIAPDSYAKIIVCGSNYNASGWFDKFPQFNFDKNIGCAKQGF